MQTGIRTLVLLSLLSILILGATCALAEVTITTDKTAYLTGEIVQITIQNLGPLGADFNSAPFVSIYNADTAECIYGCIGLAVMTPFPAGTTVVLSHDTGEHSDPNGTYSVFVNMLGPPVFTQYTVTGEVGVEARSWGAIKASYRD
jgi:hypothetical protein